MTLSLKLILLITTTFVLFSLAHGRLRPPIELRRRLHRNRFVVPRYTQKLQKLQQMVEKKGSCNPNLCFALDGSASISSDDYRAQKEFVQLVAAIIGTDEDAEFAAVQYGFKNRKISRLTNDVNDFLLKLDGSAHARAPLTRIGRGIRFCRKRLSRRIGDANKIIVLGDGRSRHVRLGKFKKTRGIEICAVGVGFQNTDMLTAIAGGNPNRVFAIDEYFELIDVVESIVRDVCGM